MSPTDEAALAARLFAEGTPVADLPTIAMRVLTPAEIAEGIAENKAFAKRFPVQVKTITGIA